MARPRFANLSSERQRAVLAVAEAEFAAHGYAGASLNQIILDASLSKGVFYYYFDDKADLAATVFEAAAREALVAVQHMRLPKGPVEFWQLFETMVRSTAGSVRSAPRQNDALYRLGMATVSDAKLQSRVTAALGGTLRVLTRFWERAQQAGAVRRDLPAPVLMNLFQSIKEGLARSLLPVNRAPTEAEVDRYLDFQIDLFRRLAEPEPTRPSPQRRAAHKPRTQRTKRSSR